MKCPKCSAPDTRVVDSRVAKSGHSIRRRRQCQQCDFRFTTIEEILQEGLTVIKRDGRREEFDRGKMLAGLRVAFQKRPVDVEQINMLISDVLIDLENHYDQEIPSSAIGEIIMQKLKSVDKIAYVRFASVYKDFRDISELETAISELKSEPHE